MGRVIAIGDVHGTLRKLEGLVEQISPTKEDKVIFLGDYIDRGPDPYHTVEYIIDFMEQFPNTVALRGNHEDFVISLFMGNMNEYERNLWLKMNGGLQTMVSYRRAGKLLGEHRDFYMALRHFWENDEFFFCHAGVRPGVPLNQQRKSYLVEIREPFLSSTKDFGKVIVHGHTITDQPVLLPNRIGIDTGAWQWGPLTAVELPSRKIWQEY
ncbi:MAG: metallophosphoesterase family protein [Smithella sp.]